MKAIDWTPLIEGMLEAVWVVDPLSLRIVAVNQAACQLQALTRDEMIGRPVIEMTASPEDMFFWEDVAAGQSDHIQSETLLRRADGRAVQVERRVSRVRADDMLRFYVVGILDHSEQRRVEGELEKLVAELRATLESTADGILVCDLDGGIRGYNQHFAQLWDIPQALLMARDDAAIHAHLATHVADTEHYSQRLRQITRSPLLEGNDLLVLRSGRVLERVTLPQYGRGRPIGRVYSFRDITDRLAAETQLQLAAKVFESSLDAIFVTDPAYRILVVNPSAGRLLQCEPPTLLGSSSRDLFFSPHDPELTAQIDEKLVQNGFWEGEVWHRRPDGSAFAVLASWVLLRDSDGNPRNIVVFAKDLTEKLAAQQRIEQLAYSDPLTGLPNRLLLTERVEHALHLAQRENTTFAILFLDLDRFKQINDSLGHLFGDRVLIEVAHRLKGCLRQTDTLSRLGGDEFVIHLHEADARAAEVTAQRILDALSKPVELDGMHFTISCSMGIAMQPGDGRTLDELIKHADTAMYRVKERGKGNFRFYQPQMNVDLLARVKMDHAMRQALADSRFALHYQPQVDTVSGALRACEALLRWNDPQLGQVSPGIFIPVAEETGFIVQVGLWVLQEAVRQAASWATAGHPLRVSVNVSALQFQHSQFAATVADCLLEHGLDPALLELELTESILIHDADEALERLQALAALGIKLSIDDFGTGYSSLGYLKQFPIHKLKIDRSFIASLHEQESDRAIVTAVVQMGHALRLEVVAEGVETETQRAFLARVGCDQFQGFLRSPGLPAAEFELRFLSGT
ncbi:sensor domain-containing protein [Hydrogenophaga sp. OTU3427]|uniref:sensor domain-containing protein n=1 Tax=Hydrogenophaga sp. OTU3427 TaxID=3043856 RepID=UPI00313F02AD